MRCARWACRTKPLAGMEDGFEPSGIRQLTIIGMRERFE
jgi:hypothetical protein